MAILGGLAAIVLALGPMSVLAADPGEKPNVLLIVADDLGWGDVGYHGSRALTPNLDRLAREGVELDQFHVQPLCTPTRTALMSGRCPSRFGPHALTPSNLRAMPLGTETIASALHGLGYETCQIGKWHLGSRIEWGPNRYGFDHSYGSLTGACDPITHQYRVGPYAKTWHRDEQFLDEEGNATELFAKEALNWIRKARRPWFIYIPFTAVHIPVDAPDEYKQLYADKKFYDDPAFDESFKRYAAYTSQMDAKIGQFVAALEQTGQRGQTLVIFFSDNGALPSGKNAYISKIAPTPVLGSNAPLRGQKGTIYEGGTRVPALVNWPGVLAPRKVTAPMHAVDWMPTITHLVGYRPATDLQWDGVDMWRVITGQKPAETRIIYTPFRGVSSLRQGDWKLIRTVKGRCELFNLAEDPVEANDQAEREPERVEQMQRLLDKAAQGDVLEKPADLVDLPGGSGE